jgi:hypothetical protein
VNDTKVLIVKNYQSDDIISCISVDVWISIAYPVTDICVRLVILVFWSEGMIAIHGECQSVAIMKALQNTK